jgi:hypothetical protein
VEDVAAEEKNNFPNIMMNEKAVMAVFRKHKRKMIKVFGRAVTRDNQLDYVGKQLFGSKFIGVFGQDNANWARLKATPNSMMIINTDPANKRGKHWVAIYRASKTIYVWDSFGRETKKLLPIFQKQAVGHKLKLKMADPDKNQYTQSSVCGQLSLAWLLTVKELGILNALKV